MVQQARNLTFHLDERADPLRFLIQTATPSSAVLSMRCSQPSGFKWSALPSGRLVLTASASAGFVPSGASASTGCSSSPAVTSSASSRSTFAIQPPAPPPCAATASTRTGRVRMDSASFGRKGGSARSTWRAAARIRGGRVTVLYLCTLQVYGRFPPGIKSRPESNLARAERKQGISIRSLDCPSLAVFGDEFAEHRGQAVSDFYGSEALSFAGYTLGSRPQM